MINQEKISSVCLGSANFGTGYGINKKRAIKKKEIEIILNYAKRNNINFLDTAINYKNSEKTIGLINKYNFKIITKLPKIPKKIINVEKWIINKVIKSCKKLKVKNLYGILVHYTSELEDKKKSKKIYRAFDYLLKKKIVKKIGLSIYDPRELDLFFKEYDYQIVQAPVNIFDRRLISSGWGKKLSKKKIEIFARSIFLKGLLLRDLKKIPEHFSEWNKNFIEFEKWTVKEKISKVEACIRFTNSFKEIKKIILGVNNLGQLKENLNFLKKKKLIVPKSLNINSGLILNPRKWKL
jgi:aryl-alcohol dehydrogenase-like predicted oxidoreductase